MSYRDEIRRHDAYPPIAQMAPNDLPLGELVSCRWISLSPKGHDRNHGADALGVAIGSFFGTGTDKGRLGMLGQQ
jgi:hypothetical protein